MSYQIIWDEKTKEFLRKIDKKDAQRIIKKVNSIIENPRRYLDTLVSIEGYKLRVGDYRVLLDIDENKKMINVLLVGLRKNIYKYLKKLKSFSKYK